MMRSSRQVVKMVKVMMLLMVLFAASCVAGCGNVMLRGEALTAAESSVMDAYQACRRVETDETVPVWVKAYSTENFKQWRYFVRSARRDLTWGPTLPNECEVNK